MTRSHLPLRTLTQGLFRLFSLLMVLTLGGTLRAQIANGGFETGDLTGWTVTTFLNPSLSGTAPFGWANIQKTAGGRNITGIVTAGTDPKTNNALAYPRFGSHAAIVNSKADGTDDGANRNGNTLSQTFTIDAAMIDPVDGKVHIRFAFAPVLDNPSHPAVQQPYFHVGVKDNTTAGAVLYDNLNFSQATGIWSPGAGSWVYTPWQVQDIPLPASTVGHSITIEFTAAGCSQGGHGGRIYVDGISPTIQGLWVSVVADKTTVAAGGQITYTYTIHNDSGVNQDNVTLALVPPGQTTLSAKNGDGNIGTLAPGATATATMTVDVAGGATGTILHDNFKVSSDTSSALYGPAIRVGVLGASTDLTVSVTSSAHTVAHQVKYLVTVTNAGAATAMNARAHFTLPANSTYVGASSSLGSIAGTAPMVASFGNLAAGTSQTLTVIVQTTDANALTGTATVEGDFTDSNAANDTASSTFTQPAALAITTQPVGGSLLNSTLGGPVKTLTVATTGGWGTLTYQWFQGPVGTTTTPVGGNSATFTAPTNFDGTFSYWVRVSDGATQLDSQAAVVNVFSSFNLTVLDSPGGLTSPSGVIPVIHGASKTFTFVPFDGYRLREILVDGVSMPAAPSYTFTNVTATHTLKPVWELKTYTVIVETEGRGSVSPGPSVEVTHGSALPFTFLPAPNQRVLNVLVDGVPQGPSKSFTLSSVTRAMKVKVVFGDENTVTVLGQPTPGGRVEPAIGYLPKGSCLTCQITPERGFRIKDVQLGGVSLGPVSTYSIAQLTKDEVITATFEPLTFDLVPVVSGPGQVPVNRGTRATYGQPLTFTCVPDPGKTVADVILDGRSLGPVTEVKIPAVMTSHTLVVTFK